MLSQERNPRLILPKFSQTGGKFTPDFQGNLNQGTTPENGEKELTVRHPNIRSLTSVSSITIVQVKWLILRNRPREPLLQDLGGQTTVRSTGQIGEEVLLNQKQGTWTIHNPTIPSIKSRGPIPGPKRPSNWIIIPLITIRSLTKFKTKSCPALFIHLWKRVLLRFLHQSKVWFRNTTDPTLNPLL